MRMDMADFENQTRYVKYSGFNVGHETSKYKVNLYGYSGIVGKIFLECNEVSFVCSNNLFHLTLISLFKEILWMQSSNNDVSFISKIWIFNAVQNHSGANIFKKHLQMTIEVLFLN